MPLTAFRWQHHAANNSKEASPSPSQGGDVLTDSRGVNIPNHILTTLFTALDVLLVYFYFLSSPLLFSLQDYPQKPLLCEQLHAF